MADRLNSLENQIQHSPTTNQSYDFGGDHTLNDAQASVHVPMKRTHSISESYQDTYKNWPVQDRGAHHAFPFSMESLLTDKDYSSNGANQVLNRRSSFADVHLAGSLIAGSNEGIIKA